MWSSYLCNCPHYSGMMLYFSSVLGTNALKTTVRIIERQCSWFWHLAYIKRRKMDLVCYIIKYPYGMLRDFLLSPYSIWLCVMTLFLHTGLLWKKNLASVSAYLKLQDFVLNSLGSKKIEASGDCSKIQLLAEELN